MTLNEVGVCFLSSPLHPLDLAKLGRNFTFRCKSKSFDRSKKTKDLN